MAKGLEALLPSVSEGQSEKVEKTFHPMTILREDFYLVEKLFVNDAHR